MRLFTVLKALFLHKGKVDQLLLGLFLAINLLVLINSIFHDPEIGYDGKNHLQYIQVLPFRLPTLEDTREFFSPPLPYILPSVFDRACVLMLRVREVPGIINDCLRSAGKFGQSINFILSLGVTILCIKTAGVIRSDNRSFKITVLALLGITTVYYKTYAQVRGEPYVVFFTVWALYLLSKVIYEQERLEIWSGLKLGVILGLLGLSRQWGFMLFPAILGLSALVWIFDPARKWHFYKPIVISFIVAFLLCGWFYSYLYQEHGSFLAFNRSSKAFSLSNQPLSFYRNTGLRNLLLFKSPTRGTFDNQFFPILYSDIWGDYWGYFTFIQDRSSLKWKVQQGNLGEINSYLGRVNAVSLFPSFIFLAGILTCATSFLKLTSGDWDEKNRSLFYTLLMMFVIVSFVFYLYFLICYTLTDQDSTNKATYMLHVLVVLPFLGAEFLEKVRGRKPILYIASMAVIGLVWVHNLPAMITRYRMFFL